MKYQLYLLLLIFSILSAAYYEESELSTLQERQNEQRSAQSKAAIEVREAQLQLEQATTEEQQDQAQQSLEKATKNKLYKDLSLSKTSVDIQQQKIIDLMKNAPDNQEQLSKAQRVLKSLEGKVETTKAALEKLGEQVNTIIDQSTEQSLQTPPDHKAPDYTAKLKETSVVATLLGTDKQEQLLNNFSREFMSIQKQSYEQQLAQLEALHTACAPLTNQEMNQNKDLLNERITQIKEYLEFPPTEPSDILLKDLEQKYELSQKIPMDRNAILIEVLTSNPSRDVVQQIMATALVYNEEASAYAQVAQELLKDDIKPTLAEQAVETLTSFVEQTQEFIAKIDKLDEIASEDSSGLEEWFDSTPVGKYVADVSDAMINKSYEWMSVANDHIQLTSERLIQYGTYAQDIEGYIGTADKKSSEVIAFINDHSTLLSAANAPIKVATGNDVVKQVSGITKAVSSIAEYLKPYAPLIGQAGEQVINFGNYLSQKGNATMDWIGMEKDAANAQKDIDFMSRAKKECARLNSIEHREVFMEVVQARVKQQQEIFNNNKPTHYTQLKEYAAQTIERLKSLLGMQKPELEASFIQLQKGRESYINYLRKFEPQLTMKSSAQEIQSAISKAQVSHDKNLNKRTSQFLKDMQQYAEASSRYTLCSKIAEASVRKSIDLFNHIEINPQSDANDIINGIIENRTLQKSYLEDLKYYTDAFTEQLTAAQSTNFSTVQDQATLKTLSDLIQGAQMHNILETNIMIDSIGKQMNVYQRVLSEQRQQQLSAIN